MYLYIFIAIYISFIIYNFLHIKSFLYELQAPFIFKQSGRRETEKKGLLLIYDYLYGLPALFGASRENEVEKA